jgi:hypothetical protein
MGQLKKFLYYAFDHQTKSVVAGPAKLSGFAGETPSVLEYGGSSEGSDIAARPYMRPADEIARPTYIQFWKDSIV